eukprot:226704_1
MAVGHDNLTLNYISFPPFHQLRCQKSVCMDTESIIRNQHWFPIYSYLLLLDCIWFIIPTIMIIYLYDKSWIYYLRFGFIENAGVGLFYGYFQCLNIRLFMVFTNYLELWRRGLFNFQMVLSIAEFINELFRISVRRMYGLRKEKWYYCYCIIIYNFYVKKK